MNYVFMFKNQVKFRGDKITDLKLLKLSIKQWSNLFEDSNKNIYVCGSYSKKDINEIATYLTSTFIEKYNITMLNVGNIPDVFNQRKTTIVNYQMLVAYDYLQEPFVICSNDVFPIQQIDDSYLNKEYGIKYNDYHSIKEPSWWEDNYIKAIQYFNQKYGTNHNKIYYGHSMYYIDKEFIDFCNEDPAMLLRFDRDTILMLWLEIVKNKSVYIKGFGSFLIAKDKWMINDKNINQLKLINATDPKDNRSRKFLNKLIKNKG